MAQKPSFDSILEMYSQEELAELYKQKVLRDAQVQLDEFKKRIADLNQLFQGGAFTETSGATTPKRRGRKPKLAQAGLENISSGKRRGRPAKNQTETGSDTESGTTEENGAGKSSKQPLGDLILSVLKKKPMKINEILEKVQEQGWNTKSNQPRLLISQELARQLKKGEIEKVERGSYKKA